MWILDDWMYIIMEFMMIPIDQEIYPAMIFDFSFSSPPPSLPLSLSLSLSLSLCSLSLYLSCSLSLSLLFPLSLSLFILSQVVKWSLLDRDFSVTSGELCMFHYN